jgi:hypothetical protein
VDVLTGTSVAAAYRSAQTFQTRLLLSGGLVGEPR